MTMRAIWLLAVCLGTTGVAQAQMNMSGHTMGTENQVPPEDLPVPQKMAGIGNAHIEITANPEAQMWFDQGLNLLHDFWDYESARAFEQAVRVDPKCAMCYWGLYRAESFYHSNAQGYAGPALVNAVRLSESATDRERLYIKASSVHEGALKGGAEGPALTQKQLLQQLVKENPKDTQAQIWLSSTVGGKEQLEILEAVMKDNPDDSAANHYYIHALEGSAHPERALHSAEILARLAPNSGHMVHMPGHIFFRMGEYSRAEQSFAASMKVDEHYMLEQHVVADNDWNYLHNLMYAIANLMEEGKFKEATALSSKLTGARGILESTLYIYSARDSISRLNPRLPVAMRTADWKQILELVNERKPLPEHPNLTFLARQLGLFASAMEAVEGGDLTKAKEGSTGFDTELSRMSSSKAAPGKTMAMPDMTAGTANNEPPKMHVLADALLQPLLANLSVMSLELRASVSMADGRAAEAKTLFAQARQAEKALGYHEPPNYIRPVDETAAASMMAARDWSNARSAYLQALVERPRSGLALYGTAICSEKSGNDAAAAKEYEDFLSAWKDADPGLPQVVHARAFVAVRRPSGGR